MMTYKKSDGLNRGEFDALKLENQLCFPLYALSREVIKLYHPLLETYDLTYTQYIVMLVMWESETITFGELAKTLHLDSGTLTPLVKKLIAKAYINKRRSEEDDRVVIVTLTEEGRALKEKMISIPIKLAEQFGEHAGILQELKILLDKSLKLMGGD
jgi:MarR family transcriptional regulator